MKRVTLKSLLALLFSGLGLLLATSFGGMGRTVWAQALTGIWTPEISVVWPQNGSGTGVLVGQSRSINVALWPTNYVPCAQSPIIPVTLWVAKNNDPLAPVATAPTLGFRTFGGSKFPFLLYNGVPADIADDSTANYTLVAGLNEPTSNVWVR